MAKLFCLLLWTTLTHFYILAALLVCIFECEAGRGETAELCCTAEHSQGLKDINSPGHDSCVSFGLKDPEKACLADPRQLKTSKLIFLLFNHTLVIRIDWF